MDPLRLDPRLTGRDGNHATFPALRWAGVVMVAGSFFYSLLCILILGRDLALWTQSLQRAVIFGASWWVALPLLARSFDARRWPPMSRQRALFHRASWLLGIGLFCASTEWLVGRLTGVQWSRVGGIKLVSNGVGEWLLHVHQRTPMLLVLSAAVLVWLHYRRLTAGASLDAYSPAKTLQQSPTPSSTVETAGLQVARPARVIARAEDLPQLNQLTPDSHVRACVGTGWEWVPVRTIAYVKAAQNYVELHLQDGRAPLLRSTLSEFEQRLPAALFVRVHRSYLVRCDAIVCLKNRNALRLRSGPEIPVGRAYWQSLMDKKLNVPVQRH